MLPRRIDKYVRDATTLSAPAARRAILDGRVTFRPPHGRLIIASDPAWIVLGTDAIHLDGCAIFPRCSHFYALLNKPKGVTCTTRDPGRKRDLSEYLARMPSGTFPVGRLDRDTTGLLLFTTEGDLATALLSPEHQTEKVYWLWLDEELDEGDSRLDQLLEGIHLKEGFARAKTVRIFAQSTASTELLLTLESGKKRQIRRMCFHAGLKLQHLHRRSLGGISVSELPIDTMRALDDHEVEILWQAAGGRQRSYRRRLAALHREAHRLRQENQPHARLEAWLRAHARTVDAAGA